MNIKKMLSLLLVICILFSMFFTVSAEESTPALEAGQTLLFSESFGAGIANWTKNTNKYFSGNKGKLVYKNLMGGSFSNTIDNQNFVFSNGHVKFEMKANSPVEFATRVRANGKTANLIAFDYAANKVRISRVVNGGKNVLLKESDFNLSNNVEYDVNIALSGVEIIVKINNQEIIRAVDNELESGYIGFTSKKGQFEIDNIVIYQNKDEEYAVSGIPDKTVKIYVAPDGNDETGDGSYEKPFATMQKARDMTVRAKVSYLPIEVIFKEGEYKIEKVTSFDSSTSGSDFAPITYRAQEGAKVEFNGATVVDHTKFEPITDSAVKERLYEHVKDKVLQLDLKAQGFTKEDLDFVSVNKEIPPVSDRNHAGALQTVKFFLNDRQQEISRWPNAGYAKIERGVQGSTNKKDPYNGGKIYFSNPEPLRWTQAKDAYVEGLMYYEWYNESIPIKEINMEDMSIDLYRYSTYGVRENHEYCVKNLLEEIDRPGEWYIDFDTMTLYYYPERAFREGDVFEVSTLKQAFVSLNGASYLNFKDITFKNSLGLVQTIYDNQGNYVDFGRYHSKNQFEDFGGGIEFGNNSHDIVIDGCIFKDIGGKGVRSIGYLGYQSFWGDMNIYVQNNNFYRNSDGAIRVGTGVGNTLSYGNFNITNNFFYENGVMNANNGDCGYTIKNNLFVRIFNHAIRCDGCEYTVDNNEISYGDYAMSDMGAIYNGRNTTEHGSSISRNLITNYGPAPKEVRSFPAGGIYLDDTVGGITLTQNMTTARSKNYQSTGVIYGGGPDVKYFGNISLDANRGFVIQNRAGSNISYLKQALSSTKARLENGAEIWLKKYPEVERMKDWIDDVNLYDAQVQIYDNLSTNNDVPTHKTNFDLKPYLTGRTDDAIILNDLSIYVDPENYDFRLKKEAVEKYNLPSTLPNEENIDIDSIGLQRDMVYNKDLVNFEITYPINGQMVDYSNKVGISWQTSDAATIYEYSIATDKEFNNIVAYDKTMDNYAEITSLKANKTYYVKVKAYSQSRKHGYEVENSNGIVEFKTPSSIYSNTALLEEAVSKLEKEVAQLDEGIIAGQAKIGTKAKASEVISDAKKVISGKPAQTIVDKKTNEVTDFTNKLDAFKNTGYATLKINKKSVWNQSVPLVSIEQSDGTAVFTTEKASTVSLNQILPNTEVVKFKYTISSLDEWHAWGLRMQDGTKAIYSDNCYYVIVKKDMFELQKKGKILKTAENTGIIEPGKEYEITFGAVTMEGGVNLYAEVDGKPIFDYLDTEDTKDLPGMFGFYIPKGTTVNVSKTDSVPAGLFQPSQMILEQSTLGEKIVFDTKHETFKIINGNFIDNKYDRNPDGATEYESKDAGSEVRWTMTTKGDTTFEVYYFHHGATGNDNNVEIILNGKDGTYKTKVDMSKGGEEYRLLGTFKFVSDNAAIGVTSIVFKGSGNGKLPISSVYIREVSNDNPDMLKPENQ